MDLTETRRLPAGFGAFRLRLLARRALIDFVDTDRRAVMQRFVDFRQFGLTGGGRRAFQLLAAGEGFHRFFPVLQVPVDEADPV